MNGWRAIQEIAKYDLIISRGGFIWSPLFGGAQGAWRVGVFSSAAWAARAHKHAHVQSPCAPPSNHPPTQKKTKKKHPATNVSYIKCQLILRGIGTERRLGSGLRRFAATAHCARRKMYCRDGERDLNVTVVSSNLRVQTSGLIIEAGKDNLSPSVSR